MRSAFGKTSVDVHLAYRMGGVVLSDDSPRVCRGMNFGTRKGPESYVVADDRSPTGSLTLPIRI